MFTSPSGRSLLAEYWPELAGVGLCLVLMGLLHLSMFLGTPLALVGYGLFRWIARSAQAPAAPAEPPVEELLKQFAALRDRPRLAPFRDDLLALTGTVHDGLLSLPREAQDSGLRELTRETLAEVLRYARQVAEMPRTPSAASPVYQRYQSLLAESAAELHKSYAASGSKDDAELASQIEQSRKDLQSLHQQLREEE